MREPIIYVKAILNLLIAIATIAVIIFVFPKVLGFFMPFVIGWIIAMIANPMVKWLEKHVKIVRKHSSAIIIVLTLALLVFLIYYLGALLGREAMELVQDLPNLYANMDSQLKSASDSIAHVLKFLPNNLVGTVGTMQSSLSTFISGALKNIEIPTVSAAGSLAKNVAEIFFMTIMTILSAYFFIAERDHMALYLRNHLPKPVQDSYRMIMDSLKKAIGGYFKAQLKITGVILLIIFIGLEILQVNYSFFIAFVIALIDLLPIFGTGAVFWPWALIDAISGNYLNAIGIMIIYVVCQVVRQILQPKMVGDSIGMSPLTTLVLMYVGYKLKGVLGMILGLPVGMILITFYQAGLFNGLIDTVKMLIGDLNRFRKIEKKEMSDPYTKDEDK